MLYWNISKFEPVIYCTHFCYRSTVFLKQIRSLKTLFFCRSRNKTVLHDKKSMMWTNHHKGKFFYDVPFVFRGYIWTFRVSWSPGPTTYSVRKSLTQLFRLWSSCVGHGKSTVSWSKYCLRELCSKVLSNLGSMSDRLGKQYNIGKWPWESEMIHIWGLGG